MPYRVSRETALPHDIELRSLGEVLCRVRFAPRATLAQEIVGAARRSARSRAPGLSLRLTRLVFTLLGANLIAGGLVYLLWRMILQGAR